MGTSSGKWAYNPMDFALRSQGCAQRWFWMVSAAWILAMGDSIERFCLKCKRSDFFGFIKGPGQGQYLNRKVQVGTICSASGVLHSVNDWQAGSTALQGRSPARNNGSGLYPARESHYLSFERESQSCVLFKNKFCWV